MNTTSTKPAVSNRQPHALSPNRKEVTVKQTRSLLLSLSALLAIGFASASNITSISVDDSLLTYTNTEYVEANTPFGHRNAHTKFRQDGESRQFGFRDAYLRLDYNGEGLQLALSNDATSSNLPKIRVSIPEYQRTYFNGDPVGPEPEHVTEPSLSDIAWLELAPFAQGYRGFKVIHRQATLSQTEAAYTATLNSLGFTVSSRDASSVNGVIVDFVNGSSQLRAVFHRDGGGGTSARLHN